MVRGPHSWDRLSGSRSGLVRSYACLTDPNSIGARAQIADFHQSIALQPGRLGPFVPQEDATSLQAFNFMLSSAPTSPPPPYSLHSSHPAQPAPLKQPSQTGLALPIELQIHILHFAVDLLRQVECEDKF